MELPFLEQKIVNARNASELCKVFCDVDFNESIINLISNGQSEKVVGLLETGMTAWQK